MVSTSMDYYNERKHDPEFLKHRAAQQKARRIRVGRSVMRKQERSYNDQLREQVLEQYGKKCGKCGFNSDLRILQLDHVNGGGVKEIRERGVRWVRRRALENPEKYQLLCPNCNWIKRYDNNEGNPRKLDY